MAASANDSSQRPLQNAMRRVKVAIQLETGNKQKEAYCEYLRSVNYISHVLLQNALSKDEEELEVMELAKMVRLAEQCLERVKSCIENRKDCPTRGLWTTTAPALNPQHTTSPPNTPPVLPTHHQSSKHTKSPPNTADSPEASAVRESGARGRAAQPRHGRVVSQGAETSCPFLPPEVFQRLQTVESQDSKKELTPIQEASRLNQKLKANYEARLSRLAPNQASQKTSLTLSLQRQMTENLIIAKAREEADAVRADVLNWGHFPQCLKLCRKMEERRLRLQEQANRRFSSSVTMTPEEQEQRVLYANILEYEQDHDWPKVWKANLQKNPYDATLVSDLVTYLLSCPDHPVMKLLKKLQCEVYQRLYPLVRRSPCPPSACPGALKPSHSVHSLVSSGSPDARPKTGLVHSLSDASLSLLHDLNPDDTVPEMDSERPLTPALLDRENSFEDLEQFLTELDWAPVHSADDAALDMTFDSTHGDLEAHIQDLEERTLKQHLKDIVKDIHNAIDRVLALCLLSFECLSTASSKDQCVACIEEVFFMPIWSPLLVLFRKVHREREMAFENSVQLYRNASPGDVGVASKLYPKDTALLQGSYPYDCAVQELKQLCRDHCPQRKLECIVRTLRLICACAEHYRLLQENDPSPHTAAIGADDLLPILSYVALRSELPQLVSECAALEDFIHEGYLIGEEGYCLTSMQSALTFVESLHVGGV